MELENRHSVKFTRTSMLGTFAATGLIILTMAITFLTIEKLYTNPTVGACFGILIVLLCCFSILAYIVAKRLNPFEYDSEYIYSRKGFLDTQHLPISYRELEEIFYSQNFIEQFAGTGTIVLLAKDEEVPQRKLRGVPDIEFTAGTLEKIRRATQLASR